MQRRITTLVPYLVLAVGLAITGFLYARTLGHDWITQWDELVHINVVHNLYSRPEVPVLHNEDLGTDYRDWTNNHIWLHKPLLPFYLRIAFHHIFGESMFVFRLPSAIFALLTSILLFFVACGRTNAWVGLVVALLFATNVYVDEFVQGQAFSDLSDVLYLFLLVVILWLLFGAGSPFRDLVPARGQASAGAAKPGPPSLWYLVPGFIAALAYFCKGGLAIPALGIFGIAALWQRKWRAVPGLILTTAAFALPVGIDSWHWSHLFPAEFHREQGQQLAHLVADIDGWGKPWDYYLSTYWTEIFGPFLAGAVVAVVFSALRRPRLSHWNGLLLAWMAVYVLPLSLGVSKTPNFIVAVLPAGLLLLGGAFHDFGRLNRWKTSFSIAAGVLALFAALHWPWLQLPALFTRDQTIAQRFLLLAISVAFVILIRLGIGLLGPLTIEFKLGRGLRRSATLVAALAAIIVIGHNLQSMWRLTNRVPPDYAQQMAMKQTAAQIRGQLPPNSVMLVDESKLSKAYLYFQYWAGINSLPGKQVDFALKNLSRRPLYLLASAPQSTGTLVQPVPFGCLYKLN